MIDGGKFAGNDWARLLLPFEVSLLSLVLENLVLGIKLCKDLEVRSSNFCTKIRKQAGINFCWEMIFIRMLA